MFIPFASISFSRAKTTAFSVPLSNNLNGFNVPVLASKPGIDSISLAIF